MAATAEQWKAYQTAKASLKPDQQSVLAEIEWCMARTEPGVTPAELNIFNDYVSDLRGRYYSLAANYCFLAELGRVNIGGPKGSTVQNLFAGVRLYPGLAGWRFAIRISDYFSEVIGAYICDEKEE